MGRVDLGAPPRLHRQGDVRRQPLADSGQRRPRAHQAGGAVREGSALLQGIAVCGRCGRKLNVAYDGARGHTRPVHQCPGRILVENRGSWCMRVGGMQIDQAAAGALSPAGVKAALQAAEALEADHDTALQQWRLQVEQARYQAERAERRYRQVEPEHRLVARGLERDWEKALGQLADAEAELTLRERQKPRALTDTEREQLLALGTDLGRVWAAPTTSDRDRKQLLRTLIDEVILDVQREHDKATVTIRWNGGAITELAVPLPRHQPTIRTDEDTIALLTRLAAHYDDGTIAGVLNRQERRSATGQRFTAQIVSSLRNHYKIPRFQPPTRVATCQARRSCKPSTSATDAEKSCEYWPHNPKTSKRTFAIYTPDGLAGDAEGTHRVEDRDVPVGRVFDEQGAELSHPTESSSPSAKPPRNSASPPPPSTAGSKPDSSGANRTHQAPRGGSVSTTAGHEQEEDGSEAQIGQDRDAQADAMCGGRLATGVPTAIDPAGGSVAAAQSLEAVHANVAAAACREPAAVHR
jgi:hypothetical protein